MYKLFTGDNDDAFYVSMSEKDTGALNQLMHESASQRRDQSEDTVVKGIEELNRVLPYRDAIEDEHTLWLNEERNKLKFMVEQLRLREEELAEKEKRMEQRIQVLQERDKSLVESSNTTQQVYENKIQKLNEEWAQKLEKEEKKRAMKEKVVEKFNEKRISSLREKLKASLDEKSKYQKLYNFLQEKSATRLSEISITNLSTLEDKIAQLEEKLRQKDEQHKEQIAVMRASWTNLRKTMRDASNQKTAVASVQQFDNQLTTVEKKVDEGSKLRGKQWTVQFTQTEDTSPQVTEKFIQTEGVTSNEDLPELQESLEQKRRAIQEETQKYEQKIAQFQQQATTILQGKKELEKEREAFETKEAHFQDALHHLEKREAQLLHKQAEVESKVAAFYETQLSIDAALIQLSEREDAYTQKCKEFEEQQRTFHEMQEQQEIQTKTYLNEGERYKALYEEKYKEFQQEYADKMDRIAVREKLMLEQKEELMKQRNELDALFAQFGSLEEQRQILVDSENALEDFAAQLAQKQANLQLENNALTKSLITSCANSVIQRVYLQDAKRRSIALDEREVALHHREASLRMQEESLNETIQEIRDRCSRKVRTAQKEVAKLKRQLQQAIEHQAAGATLTSQIGNESVSTDMPSVSSNNARPGQTRPNNTRSLHDRMDWSQHTADTTQESISALVLDEDNPPQPVQTPARRYDPSRPQRDVYVSADTSLTYYSPHYVLKQYTSRDSKQQGTTPPRQPKETHSLRNDPPHDFLGQIRFVQRTGDDSHISSTERTSLDSNGSSHSARKAGTKKPNPFPLPPDFDAESAHHALSDDDNAPPSLVTPNLTVHSPVSRSRVFHASMEHPLYHDAMKENARRRAQRQKKQRSLKEYAVMNGKPISFMEYELLEMGKTLQSFDQEWKATLREIE